MRKMKQILAFLLAVFMIVGQVPATVLAEENTVDFMGGSGTEEDPYLISNKNHLNNVRKYPDAHFLMVTDIVFAEEDFLQNGSFYNNGNGWKPIGQDGTVFSGVFDGNDHTIKNLKVLHNKTDYKASLTLYAGLFKENKGTIKNLNIQAGEIDLTASAYQPSSGLISASNYTCTMYGGAIAGINNGLIENCTADLPITLTATFDNHTRLYAGGIAGQNMGTIANCMNKAAIYSDPNVRYAGRVEQGYAGGITAYNQGTVAECSNHGAYSARGNYEENDGFFAGGIVGYNKQGFIENCYNTGSYVDNNNGAYWNFTGYAGGITAFNQQGTVQNVYNNTFIKENSVTYLGDNTNVYYGAAICGGNSGTEETTGNIANAYYLNIVSNGIGTTNVGAVTVKCTANQMKEQETFAGFDFDSVWEMGDSAYPFPVLQKQGVVVEKAEENAVDFAGGSGTASDPFRISEKVHLDNIRKFPEAHYVLENDITFTKSDFSASGAFYNEGKGWAPIEDFRGTFEGNKNKISGLNEALFEYSYGRIQNVNLAGSEIKATMKPVMGDRYKSSYSDNFAVFVKYNYGTIRNCNVSGTISSTIDVYKENVSPNYSSLDLYAYCTSRVGGISVGNEGTIENCSSSVNMSFIGKSYMKNIIPSGYSGTQTLVARTDGHIGGIAQSNGGTIKNCSFTGKISVDVDGNASGSSKSTTYVCSDVYFGGIAAENEGVITGCYSKGDASSDVQLLTGSRGYMKVYAGGIVGSNSNKVSDSYHAGTISTTGNVKTSYTECKAEIAGVANGGTVNTCYNIAKPTVSMSSKISYGVYSVGGTGDGRVGLDNYTLTEMQTYTPYEGYDFENVWGFETSEGYNYPQLKWQIPEIEEISIYEKPEEGIETLQGVYPDLSSVRVKITYSDGTSKIVGASIGMLMDFDVNQIGEQEVKLSSGDVTSSETLTIIVKGPSPVEIYINEWPTERHFYIGTEKPDVTGGSIGVIYDNGTIEIIPMTDEMISGFDSSKENDLLSLTVTYEELTTQYYVIIYGIKNITVSTLPNKTTYVQGQPLKIDGGKLTVNYTNYTSETIPLSEAEISYSETATGKVWVTVKYDNAEAGFYITVNEREIKKVQMTEPTRLSYFIGEDLDLTGGFLRVSFVSNDGYYEDVPLDADMVTGYDKESAGFQTLTVTYEEYSYTFVVRVQNKVVTSIELTSLPDKLTYLEGEEFDNTGLVITASYNNNTSSVVEDYTVSGFTSEVGKNTVTVSYGGKTVTFDVTINCAEIYDNDCDVDCNGCGAVREITHKYAPATCTEPETCEVCGVTNGEALGHDFVWIVEKEATEEEEGFKYEECTVCKHTQNETVIPKVEGIWGDVNGDKTVDTSDAQAIFNHFMEISSIEDENLLKMADVNGDGSIDTSDAQMVFNMFMGII